MLKTKKRVRLIWTIRSTKSQMNMMKGQKFIILDSLKKTSRKSSVAVKRSKRVLENKRLTTSLISNSTKMKRMRMLSKR